MDARMVFENAAILVSEKLVNLYSDRFQKGYTVDHAKLTQSYLRVEIPMTTTDSQYAVPLIDNQGTANVTRRTERKVKLQDMFVVGEIGVFAMAASGATATNVKWYTYENPIVFTGSNVASSLLQLWNGYLNFLIDGVNVLPSWDIARHYKVQRTQQGSNLYYTSSAISVLDSIDGSDDGWVPCEPNLVINGAGNWQVSINLPGAMTAVLANSYFLVWMRGVLAQNVTTVK